MANIDASMQRFLEYDTASYVGFTEQFISEFERMLLKLRDTDRYHDAVAFYEELETHLYNSRKAHNLPIESWFETLLRTLYLRYRDAGFDGSPEQMLLAVHKPIDVGEEQDYRVPVSATKAVNLLGFALMMATHQGSLHSHPHITKILRPVRDVQKEEPSFHFASYLEYSYRTVLDEQGRYPITKWDPSEGTLLLRCKYDTRDAVEEPLLSLYFPHGTVQVRYAYGPDGPSTLRLCYNDRVVLQQLALKYAETGEDTAVLTWKDAHLTMRNQETVVKGVNPIPRAIPSGVGLHVPLGKGPLSLQEVTHYPAYTVPDAQPFFFL